MNMYARNQVHPNHSVNTEYTEYWMLFCSNRKFMQHQTGPSAIFFQLGDRSLEPAFLPTLLQSVHQLYKKFSTTRMCNPSTWYIYDTSIPRRSSKTVIK